MMHFGGTVFSQEGTRGFVMTGFSKSCIWYNSGTTSESKLCFCHAFAEPNSHLVWHSRSTRSELGLSGVALSTTVMNKIH